MNEHDATEQAYNNGYKQGIRDFAERLKKKAWIIQYSEDGTITPLLSVNDIDNLLKEMECERE